MTVVVQPPALDRGVVKNSAGGVATSVNACGGSSVTQRNSLWRRSVAATDSKLPPIVSAPALDNAIVKQGTSVLMTKSDGDCVRTKRIGLCWLILALMARITTSSRSCLSVTNLPVAVTTPTVDVAVVSNCACVPLSRCNRSVLCFKGVVIPLPCDIAGNGGVTSNQGALGAWR